MNDKSLSLGRSFKLAALLVLHGKIGDNAAWIAARDAAELTQHARDIARYNVLRHNQPTTKRQDNKGRRAMANAVDIAAKYGATMHVGDPRGPVRIYWADELPKGDPDRYTNCMHDIEL